MGCTPATVYALRREVACEQYRRWQLGIRPRRWPVHRDTQHAASKRCMRGTHTPHAVVATDSQARMGDDRTERAARCVTPDAAWHARKDT